MAGVPCASADWGGEGRGGTGEPVDALPGRGVAMGARQKAVVGNVKCRFSGVSWGCPVGDAQAERLACESGYGLPQRCPRTFSVSGELHEAIPGSAGRRGQPDFCAEAYCCGGSVSPHTASQTSQTSSTSNPVRPVDLRAAEMLILFEFEHRLEEK